MWWETLLANGGVITLILGVSGFAMQWRREKYTPEITVETAESAIEFQRVQASDTVAARAIALSESTAKRMDVLEEEMSMLRKENSNLKEQLRVLISWAEDLRTRWHYWRMMEVPPALPKVIAQPSDTPDPL